METFESLLRSLWTVWFCLIFAGIAVWAYWPGRRATLDAQSRIPLEDQPHQLPR